MALGAALVVLANVHSADLSALEGECQPKKDLTTSCDFTTGVVPGVFGTALLLAGHSRPYVGGGVQLAPIVWASDYPGGGPGRVVLFVATAILNAADDPHSLGLFEAGATLSLEASPRRTVVIPFWGFGFGSLLHPENPEAGYSQALIGAHLLFTRQVTADLQLGYHYPFKEIDTLRGPRAQLTLRSAFW